MLRISKFSFLLLLLLSYSFVMCQEQKKFKITGSILTVDGNRLVGVRGVKVCIKQVNDKRILGTGVSVADGTYTVEYEKSETIDAIYGNALYAAETVPGLSGETNHTVTKVLVKNGSGNSSKANYSAQQSYAIISAYSLIQSNPQIFDPELRKGAINLDETMFPLEVQKDINELRLNAIIQDQLDKSMVAATFSGIVVAHSANDLTVRKTNGEEYSVRLLNSALCADQQTTLTKCKENPTRFGLNLTGHQIEVTAALSSANGIAVADRIKVSPN
jgi:hypothetical protein